MPIITTEKLNNYNGFEIIRESENTEGTLAVICAKCPKGDGYQYVTALVDEASAAVNAWYLGHYYENVESAIRDYRARCRAAGIRPI